MKKYIVIKLTASGCGGPAVDFRATHPSTALLVAEVAVSSEEVDREKIAIYAEAGVAEFWLVLPLASTIEIYARPQGSNYRERRTSKAGEMLESTAVPNLRVEIAALFG